MHEISTTKFNARIEALKKIAGNVLAECNDLEMAARPSERTEETESMPHTTRPKSNSQSIDKSEIVSRTETMLSTQQEKVFSEHFSARQEMKDQEAKGITAIAKRMTGDQDGKNSAVALRSKFAAERAQMLEKVRRMNMYKALQSKVEQSMKERDNVVRAELNAEKKAAFGARNRELQDELTAKSEAIRRKKE